MENRARVQQAPEQDFLKQRVTNHEPVQAQVGHADPLSPKTPRVMRQAAVLQMQRQRGNAYVMRKLNQSVQRCGAGCGCASCSGGEETMQREMEDDPKGMI